ncbi:MAG TPA: AI-2E family transporter [Casimicrobiaceae bacterium]
MATNIESRRGRPMVVWFNRRQALAVVLALLTLAVGYAGLKIVAPFVAPLTWSVTLAAIAQPLYRWLTRSLRRPWMAAALTSFIIVSALALPATYAITQMTQQALDAAQTLRDSVSDGGWKNIVKPDSPFRPATEWIDEQAQRGGYRDQLINALAGAAKYAASASLYIATDALITIFFLFFFLRDGSELLAGIRHLLPLSRDEANEVLGRVHGMITAIIYGTLVVALIQGFLGGVAFWWLGLPAPALWGAVMALASILPTVGTALVWAPTGALPRVDRRPFIRRDPGYVGRDRDRSRRQPSETVAHESKDSRSYRPRVHCGARWTARLWRDRRGVRAHHSCGDHRFDRRLAAAFRCFGRAALARR